MTFQVRDKQYGRPHPSDSWDSCCQLSKFRAVQTQSSRVELRRSLWTRLKTYVGRVGAGGSPDAQLPGGPSTSRRGSGGRLEGGRQIETVLAALTAHVDDASTHLVVVLVNDVLNCLTVGTDWRTPYLRTHPVVLQAPKTFVISAFEVGSVRANVCSDPICRYLPYGHSSAPEIAGHSSYGQMYVRANVPHPSEAHVRRVYRAT